MMLAAAGVPVQIEGGEILQQRANIGPVDFCAEPFELSGYFGDVGIYAARCPLCGQGRDSRHAVFGHAGRRSGHFAFDRSDPQARIRQAEEVNAALRKGESVVIFPEGTFTASAGIRPFQLGAFKAAVDTQRPICAVSVRGARQILRDKTILPRPGHVTLTFSPPIAPNPEAGNDWHEIVRLRDATRETIALNSGEALI